MNEIFSEKAGGQRVINVVAVFTVSLLQPFLYSRTPMRVHPRILVVNIA
jgi:hypothetical protein